MAADRDQMIGENVFTLRGDMSQKALADAMRERGYKWSQSTVWSVEKGDRPLKLAEASDLAEVFNSSLDGLLVPSFERRAITRLFRDLMTVQSYRTAVGSAFEGLLDARGELRGGLREALEVGVDRLESVRPGFRNTVDEAERVLDETVSDVLDDYMEMRNGEHPEEG